MTHLEAVRGDITAEPVDAIVNAANETLLVGGGVCGAIHRVAGPDLVAECRTVGGCPTGEARITKGYGLPAKYVIHAVGPVWHGGQQQEPELLASCYRTALQLADQHGARSISFPAISTGIFGYPMVDATRIAVTTVHDCTSVPTGIELVRFVCFSDEDLAVYHRMLETGA